MAARRGARRPAGKAGRPRIGLALAGGGPIGGVYEIGALCALQDALEGIDFADLDIYVGVSSGAFISATLANRFSPDELREIFIENRSREHPVTPDVFLTPALGEFAGRLTRVPGLMWDALRNGVLPGGGGSFTDSLSRVSRALPTGVFDNDAFGAFLSGLFQGHGRSNDFRHLGRRLVLVATDLDTGESVEFGSPGMDHVSISTAVQASSALPGLFPPVKIGDRYFVDGALRKTLHASVALREGADLVLCVNPLIPFDAALARKRGHPGQEKLVEGGLPVVLSQTFRALIYSRMQVGMAQYARQYRNAHVILFEPGRDDAEMFFTNVFSYANRHRVFDHAYRRTLADLAARRRQIAPMLRRHGIRLREAALARAILPERAGAGGVFDRLAATLDRLEAWAAPGRRAQAG